MNPPNKPCECGSGKKQKKCHPHGAPMYGPWLPRKPKEYIDGDPSVISSLLLFSTMEILSMRSRM